MGKVVSGRMSGKTYDEKQLETMFESMTPLEALKQIKSHYNDRVCIDILEDFSNVETALKRLAVYETFDLLDEKDDVDKLTDIKGKLTYVDKVMDTQERLLASVSSDEIRILSSVLNSQIRKLKKKLKALEIIKDKCKFTFDDKTKTICIVVNQSIMPLCHFDINYDSLKEVLS